MMMRQTALTSGRIWPIAVPIAFIVLAVVWIGFWFFAASKTQATITQWREREGRAGRIYACANQEIGGFPFRVEVKCADPSVELRSNPHPLSVTAAGLLVIAQAFQPTWLTGEVTAPVPI